MQLGLASAWACQPHKACSFLAQLQGTYSLCVLSKECSQSCAMKIGTRLGWGDHGKTMEHPVQQTPRKALLEGRALAPWCACPTGSTLAVWHPGDTVWGNSCLPHSLSCLLPSSGFFSPSLPSFLSLFFLPLSLCFSLALPPLSGSPCPPQTLRLAISQSPIYISYCQSDGPSS